MFMMPIEKSFNLQVVVLPACSGKTTMHKVKPNVVDAGSICDKTEVSRRRLIARVTGNWETFDNWWASEILNQLDTDKIILLVPSVEIARCVSYRQPYILAVEPIEWMRVLDSSVGRSRSNSINSYTQVIFDERCVKFDNHDLLQQEVVRIASLSSTVADQ